MSYHKTCLLLTLCVSFAASLIVELQNGRIQGATLEDYYSFTNIPYAEPPIRFEPSTPYERNWTGILNATTERRSCIQFGKRTNASDGQEDCLYLNVFVPKTAKTVHPLPVFVFIHGGAFMFASAGLYSPEIIMAQRSMIVVTMNYRLGPFGFLSTGDDIIPGNLGLKDQLLALRWVKKNIPAFGGDPAKILLTGESAGGASVHLHIMSKEAENLISAAASISGTALNPWVIQKRPKEKLETLADLLNCPHIGEDLKACLQNQTVEVFHAAVSKMQTFTDNPFNLFGPVIEPMDTPDPFITDDPRKLMEKGETSSIPWMVSFTTEEGAFNAASLLDRDENGVQLIEMLNNRWFELAPSLLFYYDEPSEQIKQTLSESLKQKYMGELRFSQDSYRKLQKMFTDVLFLNGIKETIDLHRRFGHRSIYGYVYSNPHSYGVGNFLAKDLEYQFGAAHGDDLQLVLPLTISSPFVKRPNDDGISKLMIEMFETFVLEGAPRFGNIAVPMNNNTDRPMDYLQILERNYCMGPWNDYDSRQSQTNVCYMYDSSEQIMEDRK